jgi:hypothetical protein
MGRGWVLGNGSEHPESAQGRGNHRWSHFRSSHLGASGSEPMRFVRLRGCLAVASYLMLRAAKLAIRLPLVSNKSRRCPLIFQLFTCGKTCRNAFSISMPSRQAIMVPAIWRKER